MSTPMLRSIISLWPVSCSPGSDLLVDMTFLAVVHLLGFWSPHSIKGSFPGTPSWFSTLLLCVLRLLFCWLGCLSLLSHKSWCLLSQTLTWHLTYYLLCHVTFVTFCGFLNCTFLIYLQCGAILNINIHLKQKSSPFLVKSSWIIAILLDQPNHKVILKIFSNSSCNTSKLWHHTMSQKHNLLALTYYTFKLSLTNIMCLLYNNYLRVLIVKVYL